MQQKIIVNTLQMHCGKIVKVLKLNENINFNFKINASIILFFKYLNIQTKLKIF